MTTNWDRRRVSNKNRLNMRRNKVIIIIIIIIIIILIIHIAVQTSASPSNENWNKHHFKLSDELHVQISNRRFFEEKKMKSTDLNCINGFFSEGNLSKSLTYILHLRSQSTLKKPRQCIYLTISLERWAMKS